jgi:alpha-tubulin suppressor-like RCC1 family protein
VENITPEQLLDTVIYLCGEVVRVANKEVCLVFLNINKIDNNIGSNNVYPKQITSPSQTWHAISAGRYHTLLLNAGGYIYFYGAVMNTVDATGFVQAVPSGLDTSIIATGFPVYFTSAADSGMLVAASDGKMYVAGDGTNLNLGTSSANTGSLKVANSVSSLAISKIFTGPFSYTTVVAINSTLFYGFGQNTNGQLALGTTAATVSATKINLPLTNTSFAQVSFSNQHGIYLVSGTTCFSVFATDPNVCTGHGTCISNDNCACKTGYVGNDCSLPLCYGYNSSDTAVCSGNGLCLTIDTCICYPGYFGKQCDTTGSGYLFNSGSDASGELGDILYGSDSYQLETIYPSYTQGQLIKQATGGAQNTYIIKDDGTLWSIGLNTNSALGDGVGTTTRTNYSQVVGITTNITYVCAGSNYGIALDVYGKLWGWGQNDKGQLGTGAVTPALYNTARQVGGSLTNETVAQVSCGLSHVVALTRNGTVFTWGFNSYGQLGGKFIRVLLLTNRWYYGD